jgi:flagellar basal body P-ring protein FlgI
VVPQTTLEAKDDKTKRIELSEVASIEQLVNGLQAIGATARDVVLSSRPSRQRAHCKPTFR